MNKGFTLAEVLITLGIIGVVAAMTMPLLIENHREKVTVTQLKKINSVLNNAYLRIVEEEESPEFWLQSYQNLTFNGADAIAQRLMKQMKISKYCGKKAGCFGTGNYKQLNGSSWHDIDIPGTASKFITTDGFAFNVSLYSSTCSANYGQYPLNESCAQIQVDLNGAKQPNQIGKDLFWFYLTKKGFYPAGIEKDVQNPFSNCKKTDSGAGCAAWLIYNENMDYLRCDDLSWNGKKQCK